MTAKLKLEEIVGGVDYSPVQEGEDLVLAGSSLGFHFTAEKYYRHFMEHGLGAHPGYVSDHEVYFWLATFAPFPTALKVASEIDKAESRGADVDWSSVTNTLSKGLANVVDLKVVWFYRDPDEAGRTASYRDKMVTIDLARVGDWLGDQGYTAFTTDDTAEGYCLTWVGDPIPPHVFKPNKRRSGK